MIYRIIMAFILMCAPAWGATYYIDFSSGANTNNGTSTDTPWKSHPKMQTGADCSGTGSAPSYTHSAGDKFVFKGGVTWPGECFPMSINTYGATENPDIYTGGQLEGSPWGTGYPVFDAEAGLSASSAIMLFSDGALKFTTINGLKLTNAGTTGAGTATYAIKASDIGSEITISNNYFSPFSAHAVTIHPGNMSANQTWVRVNGNKFTKATNFLEMGSAAYSGEYRLASVYIHDNEFFDPGTELVNGDHGDGIHLFSVSTGHVPNISNLYIYRNKFYGDWGGRDSVTSNTGQLYLEYTPDTLVEVWGNLFSFDNSTAERADWLFSPGYFTDGGMQTTTRVYNNTFSSDAIADSQRGAKSGYSKGPGIAAGGGGCDGLDMRNNIFSKLGHAVMIPGDGCTNSTINYNFYLRRDYACGLTTGGCSLTKYTTAYSALTDIQSGTAYEDNGVAGDPKFSNVSSAPYAFDLQSDSTAVNAGAAIGALYNTDVASVSRPQGAAWDIGAYEYASGGGDVTVPTASLSIAATATSLTVAATFSCADETGLAASPYCLQVSSDSGDCSWAASAQTAYTWTTEGAKTLYGFCKDSSNNIGSAAAGVTIALPRLPWMTP